MRLKKLELLGFKSFADKTEILFEGGVTCVVGPNGCGKSNISDSIRWVLGERSAKLLRGSSMEDVIFNGTDFRKSFAFAEVSLTIDNTDRGLPIEYQEVTLTRRLYRSGESEYLINRTLCRLKDIQDLILDTGIGSSSYSMIEQGRIDYILNANADERRFLIEEAAGISKYKLKKDEAIRKLERTEENILRLNDIVQEVHKNIQYAERQAKRAEKYKQQFEQLKDLELRKTFYEVERIKEEKAGFESERTSLESRLQELESQASQCRLNVEDLKSQLETILRRYSSEESRRYVAKSRFEQNDQQLRFNQEKRIEMATRRGENQQEESQIRERLQKTEAEIQAKQDEALSFESDKEKISNELNLKEAELQALEQELISTKSLVEASRIDLFEVSSELAQIRNESHRLAAFLETSEEQKRRLKANIERFNTDCKDWQSKGQTYENEMLAIKDKLIETEEDKKQWEEKLAQLKNSLEQNEIQKNQLERLLHEHQTRLQMLQELDAASETNKDVLLEGIPEFEKNLVHSMREIMDVEKGYEWALESVLGLFAQSLIVENTETAQKLISHLIEKKASIGIVVRDSIAVSSSEQMPIVDSPFVECALSAVVKIQPEYQNTLGVFLSQVYVIRNWTPADLKELLALSLGNCLVSKEGICFGPGSKIYFRQALSLEQNFFGRGGQMSDLEKQITECQSQVTTFIQTIQEGEYQIQEAEMLLQKSQGEQLDFKIQREAQESLRRGLEERLTSYGRELDLLNQELQDLESVQKNTQEEKRELEEQLNGIEKKEADIRHHQDLLFKQTEMHEQKRIQFLKEAAESRARYHHLEERGTFLRESLQLLSESNTRDRERLELLSQESARISEKEKNLNGLDEKLRLEQVQLDEELREAEIALELLRQEKEGMEGRIAQVQKDLQDFASEQQKLQGVLHQIEMKRMDLNYQEKSMIERIDQAYHIKMEELRPEDFPLENRSLEELDASIATLREKVETIGTVNLLAIEEYDELKKRYDFLTLQKTDMEQARESLLEAIRKINRTTKSLFEETFVKVQQAFAEYYQILFRGGEARLVLMDETHPLESGIEIMVRPPGKKLQHLTLLSGGEKALTALALLFALFKIKPSPFCVLDEVDAPLDEANVDRFIAVLRTFLQTSQFIIITHNRKTIGMGDSLYGVTMEEAGVSKIVSVKIRSSEDVLEKETDKDKTTAVEDSITA